MLKNLLGLNSREPAEARPSTGDAETTPAHAQLLHLVNTERTRFGLTPLTMGHSPVPQRHAEECADLGLISHWNSHGLKPYMRTSAAGEFQSTSENIHLSQGGTAPRGTAAPSAAEIKRAHRGLMDSPPHRATILNPDHRTLSCGIARQGTALIVAQQFDGDYLRMTNAPTLTRGRLRIEAGLREPARIGRTDLLFLQVHYDPTPRPLSRGQLIRVCAYDLGTPIAAVRGPAPPGSTWTNYTWTATKARMPDPRDFPVGSNLPTSPAERQKLMARAYRQSIEAKPQSVEVPWIDASQWRVGAAGLTVEADLSNPMTALGAGVYTVTVHTPRTGGKDWLLAGQYSILVK